MWLMQDIEGSNQRHASRPHVRDEDDQIVLLILAKLESKTTTTMKCQDALHADMKKKMMMHVDKHTLFI